MKRTCAAEGRYGQNSKRINPHHRCDRYSVVEPRGCLWLLLRLGLKQTIIQIESPLSHLMPANSMRGRMPNTKEYHGLGPVLTLLLLSHVSRAQLCATP